jgi:hypothetical protein
MSKVFSAGWPRKPQDFGDTRHVVGIQTEKHVKPWRREIRVRRGFQRELPRRIAFEPEAHEALVGVRAVPHARVSHQGKLLDLIAGFDHEPRTKTNIARQKLEFWS